MLWYFSTLNFTMFILSAPFWGGVLWPRVTVLCVCSPEACGVGASWTMDSPFLLLLCASLLPGHSTGLRCSYSLKNLLSKVLVTFNSCYQPLSLQNKFFLPCAQLCYLIKQYAWNCDSKWVCAEVERRIEWSSKSVVLNLFEVEWHLRKLAMLCTLLRSALNTWGAVTLPFC